MVRECAGNEAYGVCGLPRSVGGERQEDERARGHRWAGDRRCCREEESEREGVLKKGWGGI